MMVAQKQGYVPEIKKRRNAFTLIEMLVVLVIVMILTAVALPNFVSEYRLENLRSASSDWREMALLAKEKAVINRQIIELTTEHGSHQFALKQPEGKKHKDYRTFIRKEFSDKISVKIDFSGRSKGMSGQVVRFYPDGTADEAEVLFEQSGLPGIKILIDPLTASTKVLSP